MRNIENIMQHVVIHIETHKCHVEVIIQHINHIRNMDTFMQHTGYGKVSYFQLRKKWVDLTHFLRF